MLNRGCTPIVFIAGNPRSGTTLMARILGNHHHVHRLPQETHFMGELWCGLEELVLSGEESERLLAKLIAIQWQGYFSYRESYEGFISEARHLLERHGKTALTYPEIYRTFLLAEADRHGKPIPCEKTPGHVYYVAEILELFPESRVILVVRDPRDVLLSQKMRWRKRPWCGPGEVFRLFGQYHPVTMALLWRAAAREAKRFSANPRVLVVRFEDLLESAESEVKRICGFIGISFDLSMLDVPQTGSSIVPDSPEGIGIDRSRIGNWRNGGLNPAEIWFCQKIAGTEMEHWGYGSEPVKAGTMLVMYFAWHVISAPLKLALGYIFNRRRMGDTTDSLRRRILALRSGRGIPGEELHNR